MSKNCREITGFIETKYPLSLAETYDNVGLLIGSYDAIISKVLVCLEINDEVIDEAINNNVDMIISHHPLIFTPFKKIIYSSPTSHFIARLIKADICVYGLHTNFDNAENGMNDVLSELLGLNNINKLGNGTGRYGILYNSMFLYELCNIVKSKLNINSLRVIGNLNSKVERVAVVGGAGCDFIDDAIALHCDVFITGDVKHHSALDAINYGINIIDASHYSTEIIAIPFIVALLRELTDLEVISSKIDTNPFKTL